jgi:transposase
MSKAAQLEKLGKLTVGEFFARFPDDNACLTHIFEVRYGLRHICQACGVEGTFHKLSDRKAFSCSSCGDHVYPCAGTIFQDSRTPLRVWFYAVYLFVTTRHGVSGKELQRSLGVTYKCAWRMGQQIRTLMAKADGFEKLKGHVEVDETYVGGAKPGRGLHRQHKTIVLGMKERGGRTQAEVIPNVKMGTMRKALLSQIERGSTISTDELRSYNLLKSDGYTHGNVQHNIGQYRNGEYSTNGIESFWKLFKNSVRSTHIHVSSKYMNKYLGEFTFRSNHRAMAGAMFDLLIVSV